MSTVLYYKKHRHVLVQIGYVQNGQPSLQFILHPHFFSASAFDYSLAFGIERHLVPLTF